MGVQMRGVHITLRMRLECRIVRQNQRDNTPPDVFEVMNEVVVDRGANPYLAKIECWERDTLITKVNTGVDASSEISSCLEGCLPRAAGKRLLLSSHACGYFAYLYISEHAGQSGV